MTKEIRVKLLAVTISLAVIILLILSGPAGALSLKIEEKDKHPQENDTINLKLTVDLNNKDNLALNNLSLILDNNKKNEKVICIFNASASVISGCNGMNISVLSNNLNYSFGYYSGKGDLVFNVQINLSQSDLEVGNNKLSFVVDTPKKEVSKKETIDIKKDKPKK